jgi:predicted PurR-regulated permease PerM
MSLVIGVLAGVGTGLLGLPYFVVLGVLAGLFELVPMFGPVLSAVPAVIVALFLPWPTVLWVVLLFVVIQQFESNVLGPRVTGHAVGLHPLGALFALLVGFEVAGILGGLFAAGRGRALGAGIDHLSQPRRVGARDGDDHKRDLARTACGRG